MKKRKYELEDIKVGNHVMFKRIGIDDFQMYWTVIGFRDNMIHVKIDDMGDKGELYIDITDIEILEDVDDKRFTNQQ